MTKHNMLNSRDKSGSAMVIVIEHLKWKYNLLRDRIYACFSTKPMYFTCKGHYSKWKRFCWCRSWSLSWLSFNKDSLQIIDIKLFLIDSYGTYIHDGDAVFENVKKRLVKMSEKNGFISKISYDAINDVADELGFVYIDGNHEYEYVKNDFIMFYPKVKQEGII